MFWSTPEAINFKGWQTALNRTFTDNEQDCGFDNKKKKEKKISIPSTEWIGKMNSLYLLFQNVMIIYLLWQESISTDMPPD